MSEVRLEGYKLEGALGSGAVSSIYRAVHEATGREVVLKALKASIPTSSSFALQLEREARILSEMSHPNVVLLIDFRKGDTGGGRTFLVLERVDGFPLRELLRKKRTLRADVACAIACEVLSGLEHAHARGIVHRDIKPENILLGKRGDVKIVDFGIAQRDRLPSANEPLPMSEDRGETSRKEAFGAPAYMSPEQVLGEQVDPRSDLYSLGVVLYRMLSGARPEGEALAKNEAERKAAPSNRPRRDAPVPLSDRAKDLPRGLDHIVMSLLERRPEDRYKDATIVRELLEPYAHGGSKESHARTIRHALFEAGLLRDERARSDDRQQKVRRERPWLTFVGMFLIGLVFSGVGVFIQATSQKGTEATSEPEPTRCRSRRARREDCAYSLLLGPKCGSTVSASTSRRSRARCRLSAGTHFVTLKHPDAPDEKRTVEVTSGEVVQLDVTMNVEGAAK